MQEPFPTTVLMDMLRVLLTFLSAHEHIYILWDVHCHKCIIISGKENVFSIVGLFVFLFVHLSVSLLVTLPRTLQMDCN